MRYYRSGLKIPRSGIYEVIHSRHRLPHEVTLLAGGTFPRCGKCGNNVQFGLIRAADDLDNSEVRVVLCELPESGEFVRYSAASLVTRKTARAFSVAFDPKTQIS